MGLLYPFPVSEEEKDHVIKTADSLTIKSYGLPYIFWLYLLCILSAIFLLFIGIKNPLMQIFAGDDVLNKYLALALITLFIALPTSLLAFFFYEKRIIKGKDFLSVEHLFFGIRVKKNHYTLNKSSAFEIKHHLDSPNVAALRKDLDLKAFENRGHHELFLLINDKKIFLDRHSQLSELKKLKAFLELF
jgi:hypothetical protein